MIFVLSACGGGTKDTAVSPPTSAPAEARQPAAQPQPDGSSAPNPAAAGTRACGTITDSYTGDPLKVVATNATCAEATAVIKEFNGRYVDDEEALKKVSRTVTHNGRTWTCDFDGDDHCTAPGGLKVVAES
jgi:hypothetical protein